MGLEGKVKAMVKDEGSGTKPKRKPREGWDEKFRRAVVRDETLLIPDDLSNEFDETERTW